MLQLLIKPDDLHRHDRREMLNDFNMVMQRDEV